MSTSADTNTLDLLKGDKGEYQPLSLPSLGSVPPNQPAPQPHMQLLSASQKSKYKGEALSWCGHMIEGNIYFVITGTTS